MSSPLLEAYEQIAHSHVLLRRLDAAIAELAKRPGLDEEKQWLAAGRARLESARGAIGDILDRALRLEELAPMRGGRSRELQGEVIDALERLHAGIAFAGGARSPLLDALFMNMKLPILRKVAREEMERAWADFDRRLGSTYAKRMLADETYVVVAPTVKGAAEAYATWQGSFEPAPLPPEESRALGEELITIGDSVDLPSRQARLLAQAALLAMRELLDEHGLTPKPKRKGAPDPDTHALLEQDPPDPAAPTPEEREELEGSATDGDDAGEPGNGKTKERKTDRSARARGSA